MNGSPSSQLTFALLDCEEGIPEPPENTGEEFPLPAWYRAIRNTPLEQLGIEDICKACRQRIHPEYVVPIALRLIQSEPLVGGVYDGELLASLKALPRDYWSAHPHEATNLKEVCNRVADDPDISADLRQDVADLLKKSTA